MISFDLQYFQPNTIEDAINIYEQFISENKKPIYASGGTEIISRARRNEVQPDAIIDLKNIPGFHKCEHKAGKLQIGSAVTLNHAATHSNFPLLKTVIQSIATQTARNKITIGGNLASSLPYREAVLPLLLTDSTIVLATPKGAITKNIHDVFPFNEHLKELELMMEVHLDSKLIKHPHFWIKKTKQSQINYPIVSVAAMHIDNEIRIATSGLTANPLRMKQLEKDILQAVEIEDCLDQIESYLPSPIIDDMIAQSDYRLFLFKQIIKDIAINWKGAS
ncbi:FAD binding domain-containing protein [Ornithinibacillus gellani]|uniref:FAD binding domain-containing protein n=1 Tax=Ornithinibacillus gellani TaxID=2293253 RepID=UPI0016806D8C|nr:FAD binding domain-containing protein [Ornithinibacillus gellani]